MKRGRRTTRFQTACESHIPNVLKCSSARSNSQLAVTLIFHCLREHDIACKSRTYMCRAALTQTFKFLQRARWVGDCRCINLVITRRTETSCCREYHMIQDDCVATSVNPQLKTIQLVFSFQKAYPASVDMLPEARRQPVH